MFSLRKGLRGAKVCVPLIKKYGELRGFREEAKIWSKNTCKESCRSEMAKWTSFYIHHMLGFVLGTLHIIVLGEEKTER